MNKDFNEAIEARRSVYSISKDITMTDEEILDLVNHAVQFAPSAYNSQSARVLVLLGVEHEKLWDFTSEILRKKISADLFPITEAKLNNLRSGYGTILFFEDQGTIRNFQEQFKSDSDNFLLWSLQSSGMLQVIIWTSLEAEGFGASLQHYNPLIDEVVKATWDIPDDWTLLSEMPFGKSLTEPDSKTFLPLWERTKFFK